MAGRTAWIKALFSDRDFAEDFLAMNGHFLGRFDPQPHLALTRFPVRPRLVNCPGP